MEYLILDEAQMTYDCCQSLWSTIKAASSSASFPNLRIIFFSSYAAVTLTTLATPFSFPPESTIGLHPNEELKLPGLLLSEEEFDEMITIFGSLFFPLPESVQQKIFALTNGHAGLIKIYLDKWSVRYVNAETRVPDLEDRLHTYIYSREMQYALLSTRGLPKSAELESLNTRQQEHCYKIMDTILLEGAWSSANLKTKNPLCLAATFLVKIGFILERSAKKFEFPTPIYANCYLIECHGEPGTESIVESFKDFILETFRRVNPNDLMETYSTGTSGKILERKWQMEFYRAACSVFAGRYFVSPDASTMIGLTQGAVDFWIDDNLNWAIELLREGQDMKEHAQRFEIGGRYAPLLKRAQEWCIIDIRSEATKVRVKHPRMWHVMYTNDYKSAIVHGPNRLVEEIALLGEQVILNNQVHS